MQHQPPSGLHRIVSLPEFSAPADSGILADEGRPHKILRLRESLGYFAGAVACPLFD
jgi:hypothetical protein